MTRDPSAGWALHADEWRDPGQVVSAWADARPFDRGLLKHSVRGRFWDALAGAGATLLVTREYEHLLMALTAGEDGPMTSYLRLPHPSGIAVDRKRGRVFVASTRNPNVIYELAPVVGALDRLDDRAETPVGRPLVPVRSAVFPGSLYLHDLAFVGGELHGNAVGHNAVVRIEGDAWRRVWWPRSIDGPDGPAFGINYLQLNSIAAGPDLSRSFFSASAGAPSSRRPGQVSFPVDRRGVIFSGRTREPVVTGLTRPHSARLHRRRLWVANSGYGELAYADDGATRTVARLPGWTRGLCFAGGVAFVGTSRVIPKFRAYAPGLDIDRSVCGVHAVDLASGKVVGSLTWPAGNQVFAVEWVPRRLTLGLPFAASSSRAGKRDRTLFYTFETHASQRGSHG